MNLYNVVVIVLPVIYFLALLKLSLRADNMETDNSLFKYRLNFTFLFGKIYYWSIYFFTIHNKPNINKINSERSLKSWLTTGSKKNSIFKWKNGKFLPQAVWIISSKCSYWWLIFCHMSVVNFLVELERKTAKLKTHKISLPEPVLANRALISTVLCEKNKLVKPLW